MSDVNPFEQLLNQAAQAAPPAGGPQPDPQGVPAGEPPAAPPAEGDLAGGLNLDALLAAGQRQVPGAPETPQNPYFQQQVEALRAQAQTNQQRADLLEMYLLNNWVQSHPEGPQREAALARAQTYLAQKAYAQELQRERQFRQHLENSVTPLLQDAVYTRISQQTKIPKEILVKYGKTPEQVRAIIEAYSELSKRQNFEQRVEAKLDAAPESAGGQAEPQDNLEAIKAKYRNTGNLAGYLKEVSALRRGAAR